MDFTSIFQIKAKKFWWMDVILYFAVSSLIATLFCYLIFSTENNLQRANIQKETIALQSVGTDDQKLREKDVINYQVKIKDFSDLIKNHEFASNVFAFMQAQTLPNVWFKQFNLSEKDTSVQLSGESDNMDVLSRQVAAFEKNEYVSSISSLSSTLGNVARSEFNVGLNLKQNILEYLADTSSATVTSAPSTSGTVAPAATPAAPAATPASQTSQQTTPPAPAAPAVASGQTLPANTTTPPAQPSTIIPGNGKSIISFNILNPYIIGAIEETNYTITLNVPSGTDIRNLTPLIAISSGASIVPASNVSQDFTNPVTYTVTAGNGLVQTYQAKAIVAGAVATPVQKQSSSKYNILIIIALAVVAIAIIAGIILLILRKYRKPKTKF